MSKDEIGVRGISKPAIVFVLIVLVIIVLLIAGLSKEETVSWDQAANTPAENAGLTGVSAEERDNLRAAGRAPGEGQPANQGEQQAFLDAAAVPAQ